MNKIKKSRLTVAETSHQSSGVKTHTKLVCTSYKKKEQKITFSVIQWDEMKGIETGERTRREGRDKRKARKSESETDGT